MTNRLDMVHAFYFIRVDGVDGRTFATKRAAVAHAKRAAKSGARVSVWFRDLIGQDIPVNWRSA